MNILQVMSLQLKKLLDKINSVSSTISTLGTRLTAAETKISDPELRMGLKREYIGISQAIFNNNGSAFTDRPVKFKNRYKNPICTVVIMYKTASMVSVQIAPYSVTPEGCELRFIVGNKRDLGPRYTAWLKVEEGENKP